LVDVKQLAEGWPLTEIHGRPPALVRKLELFLHGRRRLWLPNDMQRTCNDYNGNSPCCRRLYWLASYKLALWVVVYAIIYGGLGIVHGDNHARPVFRGDSEFTVALLMPVVWHIGGLAGYL
jgi:hypothetical protein